jgi:hypothetical protein
MDAMLLISALNNRAPGFSSQATIIEDLKTQSRTWFSSCSFSRRCTNTVAHVLAQVGARCDVNSHLSWEYEVPLCANDAVMADLAQTVS